MDRPSPRSRDCPSFSLFLSSHLVSLASLSDRTSIRYTKQDDVFLPFAHQISTFSWDHRYAHISPSLHLHLPSLPAFCRSSLPSGVFGLGLSTAFYYYRCSFFLDFTRYVLAVFLAVSSLVHRRPGRSVATSLVELANQNPIRQLLLTQSPK